MVTFTELISIASNIKRVSELLNQHGSSFAAKLDIEGHTLVHWAALGGFHDLVDFLVEQGAPLNQQSNNDYGPLPIHWACVHGHILTVEYFLNKGIDIDATDRNGCTPLTVSAQYGESLCVSYLLQKGANKFHVDINGDSALHWASFKGMPLAWLLKVRHEPGFLCSPQGDSFICENYLNFFSKAIRR